MVCYTSVMKTIRTIAIVFLLALIGGAVGAHLLHKPKPVPVVHYHRPAPAQVTHGVKPPYEDCTPNPDSTPAEQAELSDTERQMAKYNNVPDNTNNSQLQYLTDIYKNQVAEFDTCTLVTN